MVNRQELTFRSLLNYLETTEQVEFGVDDCDTCPLAFWAQCIGYRDAWAMSKGIRWFDHMAEKFVTICDEPWVRDFISEVDADPARGTIPREEALQIARGIGAKLGLV